ncbi:hypothetical protein ACS0TY_020494 [Phlomoides rotata]
MPFPNQVMSCEGSNKLIHEELRYDKTALEEQHRILSSQFTTEQNNVFSHILHKVESDEGGLFFLYGYGGTGKTFIWNALSAALRSL